MTVMADEVRTAIEAYERIAGHPATRTWQMIRDHGEIVALSRLMKSGDLQTGFKKLVDAGRSDLTFEAIVSRHSGKSPVPVLLLSDAPRKVQNRGR